MTTHIDALRAKTDQATTALHAAEQALADALRAAGIEIPSWATAAEVSTWRCVETRLEAHRPPQPLAAAYSAFRRAQNAERKARSAAHKASFDAAPAAPPAPAQPRRKKAARQTTFADQVRAIWADEAEARAA